jgi:hypothetical protein
MDFGMGDLGPDDAARLRRLLVKQLAAADADS